MKITAADLKELGVIERVIREPEPASIDNIIELSEEIREMIVDFLKRYKKKMPEEIVEERYQRFRKM